MSDERLLETFLDLVRIYSPSRRESGVASYCARELSALGFEVDFDDAAFVTGSDTGNLIARLPGTGTGSERRRLVLSAHMDCVEPCEGVSPAIRRGAVFSDGTTVLGADDKVGIAVILECVRRRCESSAARPDLQVVLTVQEEVGLHGAKALAPERVSGADLCLVLDAEGPPGGIIVAAPTHYTFVATFEGRSAHAGVAPEHGVNAIALASRAVDRMRLGRLDDVTTANVGSIAGGSATNVVPSLVTMTGECRSLDRPRVEALRAEMDQTMREAAASGGGRADIAWTLEYESFAVAEDDPSTALLGEACADVGLEPLLLRTGGGSDANIFSALGVPTLAISCGMQNVHSVEESIELEDLHALAALIDSVIARLAV